MTPHRWTEDSHHPTSEGLVVYESCHCGLLRIRLVEAVTAGAAVVTERAR